MDGTLYKKNPDGSYAPADADRVASALHIAQENPYDQMVKWRRAGSSFALPNYVTVDDTILVSTSGAVGGTPLNVSMRYMTPEGRLVPEFYPLLTSAGSITAVKAINGSEGFLLSVTVETPGVRRGACFVQVELVRGQGSGDTARGEVLYAGYPGFGFRQGFPQTPVISPTDGRGLMFNNQVGSPAAGSDWTLSLSGSSTAYVRAITFVLATAVAVANRQVFLTVKDGSGNITWQTFAPAVQAASLTQRYNFGAAAAAGTSAGADPDGHINYGIALPTDLRLGDSFSIGTRTTNLQAADQYSAIGVLTESFVLA